MRTVFDRTYFLRALPFGLMVMTPTARYKLPTAPTACHEVTFDV